MTTQKIVLKIAALTCFVALISMFVAYKSGAFASRSNSPVNHVYTTGKYMNEDSLKKKAKADSLKRAQMRVRASSSKSMVVFEEEDVLKSPFVLDTTKKDSTQAKKSDSVKVVPKTRVYSTKSGRIFVPEDQMKKTEQKKSNNPK